MGGNPWVRGFGLTLVLVLGLFSGCVDDPGSPEDEEGDGEGSQETDEEQDPGEDDPEAPPLVEEAREVTMYVTADGSLSMEVPSAGAIEQGDWVPDYFQGQFDPDPFTFESDALQNASLIHPEPVQVALWVESDTPQPPVPGFDATAGAAFFGSSKGMPLNVVEFSDPVFPPGEPVQFEMTLEWGDFVPVVIPAGERVALFAGLVALTTDAAPARILVGGEQATSVTFSMSNLSRDPSADLPSAEVETFTGVIENPDTPRHAHSFDLAEGAQELHVQVDLSGGTHESDLDLDLFDADGGHISGSHTPSTHESVYLMGPALDGLRGTTLTVEVGHFFAVDAEYELSVSQR